MQLLTLLAAASLLTSGTQQTAECRVADNTSRFLINKIGQMTSSTPLPVDAVVRDSLRLTASGTPTLVTNSSVCRKARAAYEAAVAQPGSTFSGSVYTIKAGNRFVVLDPVYRSGGLPAIVIFDSKWRMLSNFF